MKAAQKNPEKYKNLQVRLCGWNVYFTDLEREVQNQLIETLYQIRNASKYIKKDILLKMRTHNSYNVEIQYEESYFEVINNLLTVEVYDGEELVSRTETRIP